MTNVDNRPRTPGPPRKDWQRPWAVQADLRHDEAIAFPAPNIMTGEMLTMNLLTEDPLVGMMFGSGFTGVVIDERLVRELFDAWRARSLALPMEKVQAIKHSAFPAQWFVPVEAFTKRAVAGMMVESGIKLMTFWVRPKIMVVRAGRNGK